MNFDSKPYLYFAKVTRVIDGDSYEVTLDYGHGLHVDEIKIRLARADTPEVTRPKSELEREAGQAVKDYLITQLEGKKVMLESLKKKGKSKEKYGGYLYQVWFENGINLNKFLVEQGLAREYHGGHKEPWDEKQLKKIIEKVKQFNAI